MASNEDELQTIVEIAGKYASLDFRAYKMGTLGRRIRFRAAGLGQPTIGAYRELLEREPAEQALLVSSLLVKTTWMFRDEGVYQMLRAKVLPALVASRRAEGAVVIRAWVPACSTGEEAFSLAMCLAEATARGLPEASVVASDVDWAALERVSRGAYSRAACASVPDDLRARWLEDIDDQTVRVHPSLSAIVTSAYHDLLGPNYPVPREAVLASFDVISCRNVLIYLRREAQEAVITRILKAASRGSLLMLGHAESVPAVFNTDVTPVLPGLPLYWIHGPPRPQH